MTSSEHKPISSWIPVAFGVIGFLVGFMAGLSLTPVVGTLLPLLFAVIGGGSGFFATQKPEYSRIVGLSVVVLGLTCLGGSVYGIRLREGLPWRCFVSSCEEKGAAKLVITSDITEQDAFLHLVSIRSSLLSMDLSKKDQEQIFALATKLAMQKTSNGDSLDYMDSEMQKIAENEAKLKLPTKASDDSNRRPVMKH